MASDKGESTVKRYGMVIEVRPDKIEEYKKLHANAWPGVLKTISDCNIRNYSIYFREITPGNHLLFSYFEYTGGDFDGDMKKMAADPVTQEWWGHCIPCVKPIPCSNDGELWSEMEEVFHSD